jgi:hypothetical protein
MLQADRAAAAGSKMHPVDPMPLAAQGPAPLPETLLLSHT